MQAADYFKHNYVKKLEQMIASGSLPPGSVNEVNIQHDDSCALLTIGGRCDCNPDITIRKTPTQK